ERLGLGDQVGGVLLDVGPVALHGRCELRVALPGGAGRRPGDLERPVRLRGPRAVDLVGARPDRQREAAGQAGREVLLLAQDVGLVVGAQLGLGYRGRAELVMSNSTAPAGTLAGLGSQPCDVIWILTVLDLSPAAAAVPVDPLAPEPEPELAHPAATRARLAASTATAAPRRLARIPLLRTIKNSSRLTDR